MSKVYYNTCKEQENKMRRTYERTMFIDDLTHVEMSLRQAGENNSKDKHVEISER